MSHVMTFHIVGENLKFDNQEQALAFQQALGRQVMYALINGYERDTMTTHSIMRDKEITSCYFGDQPLKKTEDEIWQLTNTGRSFVMGAIPHSDNTYSYHS